MLLALLSLNKLLRKRTETDVAFTLEYSTVLNPRGTVKRNKDLELVQPDPPGQKR